MDLAMIKTINISIESTAFVISSSLLIGLIITKAYRSKLAKILLAMLIVNAVVLFSDIIAWSMYENTWPFAHVISKAANFVVYTFGYLYNYLIAIYVYTYIYLRNTSIKKWLPHIAVCASILMVTITIISQFTGWLYHIDEYNKFVFGPLNSFSYCVSILMMMASIITLIIYRECIGRRNLMILLLFLIIPIAASVIEVIVQDIMLIYLSCSASFILLYVSIQIQQEINALEKRKQMEMELSDSRAAIMLSQIQPHFLYNSLLAIQDLCGRDAELAEKTVGEFSKYLRGNLDSLTNKYPIYFEKELEHVKTYISLEKKRFEELLQIEFDIKVMNFLLPALTLQTIVENAIQHGVTKQIDGGKVSIRTYDDENTNYIEVIDNGIGFDTTILNDKGQEHVGIQNVRYRLDAMCSGVLEVQSEIGAGTTVIISIPKGGFPK